MTPEQLIRKVAEFHGVRLLHLKERREERRPGFDPAPAEVVTAILELEQSGLWHVELTRVPEYA